MEVSLEVPVQKLFSSHKYLPMHLLCGQLRKYNFVNYCRLDHSKIIYV